MKILFNKLSFIMTLFAVLLCGYAVSVIGLNHTQGLVDSTVSQDSRPDIQIDTLVPRLATPRVIAFESTLPNKDTIPWPIALISMATLIGLLCIARGAWRRYIFAVCHRLAGLQESNLQFRFIHSR